MQITEEAIKASSLRNKVISNNIAHVNTPNYKKSTVCFEEKLRAAMETSSGNGKIPLRVTNDKHIQISDKRNIDITPETKLSNTTTMRTDGNNVDIDIEMAELAKNTIYYQAAVQQLSRQFGELRTVINEGRR